MKDKILLWIIGMVFVSGCTLHKASWIESTDGTYWKKKCISLSHDTSIVADAVIDANNRQQVIDGFGACFNELGWDALNTLDNKAREEVLKSLFDTVSGLNLRICRMPIGANDYARSWYSLDDSVGDFSMKHFSIARDQQTLIPYIKAAMKYNPGLKIWGSPWCPPAWMKTNGHYACRPDKVNDLRPEGEGMENKTQFRMEDPYLKAYALYFTKYVEAYRNEGIHVFAVNIQNEPNSCQNFPSCVWTAKDLNTFTGKYLGPAMKEKFPDMQIWYGTIERPSVEKIDTVLQDPESSKYVAGVAFQWAGKDAIAGVHSKYPSMKLMQSETECGDGSNDWKAAAYTYSLMQHYFDNGASIYSFWNPVLDKTGKSQWGWKQNSMITINSATKKVVYNPEFYLLKHFSSFIQPGARKLAVSGAWKSLLAFGNPDHSIILVVYNSSANKQTPRFRIGNTTFSPSLAPESFNTFVIPQP